MGAKTIRALGTGVVAVREPSGERGVVPRGANMPGLIVLSATARLERHKIVWSSVPELPRMRAELQLKPDNGKN
jgi:hypothetical protein